MITIFGMRMAGFLLLKGFVLVNLGFHRSGNGMKVFYFNESPEIRLAMKEFSENQVEIKKYIEDIK
jgi:hypothetical protein